MNRIKELRKAKKITLVEMGEKLDIPRSTLSRYENEESKPKQETWQKLADFFNVTVAYLMGLDNDYLDIGKKHFDALVSLLENERKEDLHQIDLQFLQGSKTFSQSKIDRLIVTSINRYFTVFGQDSPIDADWIALYLEDSFSAAYLKDIKSNQNFIQYVLNLFDFFDEINEYPIIDKYTVINPKSKNEYIDITEYSGSVSLELQEEISDVIHQTIKYIEDLKKEYENENNENTITFSAWDKDFKSDNIISKIPSRLIGEISGNEITTSKNFNREDLLALLKEERIQVYSED